ncbi:MAG: hypothetical protein JNK33_06405 [Candidatus Doudnabacteria bacterium]|nr:hypothetical protein [Candidatus Doudnabacteria bacterium]
MAEAIIAIGFQTKGSPRRESILLKKKDAPAKSGRTERQAKAGENCHGRGLFYHALLTGTKV